MAACCSGDGPRPVVGEDELDPVTKGVEGPRPEVVVEVDLSAESVGGVHIEPAHLLDVRCAKENPEEAWNECGPRGDDSPERRGNQWGKLAGMLPAAHESHELQHHDERSRGGLGQPESIEHLRSGQPTMVLHRLLGNIGKHGVGAAEGDHRGFAEEDAFADQRVGCTQPQREEQDGSPPEGEADGADFQGARQGGTRM